MRVDRFSANIDQYVIQPCARVLTKERLVLAVKALGIVIILGSVFYLAYNIVLRLKKVTKQPPNNFNPLNNPPPVTPFEKQKKECLNKIELLCTQKIEEFKQFPLEENASFLKEQFQFAIDEQLQKAKAELAKSDIDESDIENIFVIRQFDICKLFAAFQAKAGVPKNKSLNWVQSWSCEIMKLINQAKTASSPDLPSLVSNFSSHVAKGGPLVNQPLYGQPGGFNTLLYLANHGGPADFVNPLANHKCNFNATDNNGFNALMHAAAKGHFAISSRIIDLGMKYNLNLNACAGLFQNTALHLLVANNADLLNTCKLAKKIIDKGGQVNLQNAPGQTVIHVATLTGHATLLNHLKDIGGDFRITNKQGQTPYHLSQLTYQQANTVMKTTINPTRTLSWEEFAKQRQQVIKILESLL